MNTDPPGDDASGDTRPRTRVVDDHAAFLRSMSQVDWLALLVVGLYLLVDATPLSHPVVTLLAMVLFAAFSLGLRWRRLPLRSPRARIALDVAVTIVFISVAAAQSGGPASPLVNLYLLPVVLAAVALGGRGTLVVFVLVAGAWVFLMAAHGDLESPAPAVIARIFGQLGPFALVAYLTQRLAGSIIVARQRIAELAERDGLTGLVNQRSFRELLQREGGNRSRAGSGGYAVLMVDMDRLKHVNDTWGHEAGNAAICNVAEAIKRAIRKSDVAGRYGGDEFAVFLPDATPQVAEVVAQRIRNNVFKSLFPAGGRLQRITVSVGVGAYPQDGSDAEDALAAADRRMYQDKSLRRKPGDPEPPRPARL
jgi:diguanylate cyclase (GGDEF)-like protein